MYEPANLRRMVPRMPAALTRLPVRRRLPRAFSGVK